MIVFRVHPFFKVFEAPPVSGRSQRANYEAIFFLKLEHVYKNTVFSRVFTSVFNAPSYYVYF